MSATYGTNSDTCMSSLKFNSTGRTVEFTVEESEDFEKFLLGIKMQGKLAKGEIGVKAADCLAQLGDAIEEGDPQTIADIWVRDGQRVVEAAVLNNIIIKEARHNPFALFYIGDSRRVDYDFKNVKKALEVTKAIEKILNDLCDELAKDTYQKSDDPKIQEAIHMSGIKIRSFRNKGVGVGDTAADGAIADKFRGKLMSSWCQKSAEDLSSELYSEIHGSRV